MFVSIMPSKCLQDIYLQDVFKTYLFKAFLRDAFKTSLRHVFKTSWWCLQRQQMFARVGIVSKIYYFNLMVSICFPLILLSALLILASTSTAILHNSIRVKGSDRSLFILILDSILIYTTWTMWMNLSPYTNICKAEKIKSTLRILQKDFYSIYLTHQLWHK